MPYHRTIADIRSSYYEGPVEFNLVFNEDFLHLNEILMFSNEKKAEDRNRSKWPSTLLTKKKVGSREFGKPIENPGIDHSRTIE